MRIVIYYLIVFWTISGWSHDTELKLYRPFGGAENQVTPLVKNTLRGSCTEQSKLIKREDAWQCHVKDTLYDPCFIQTHRASPHKAICPQSPWMEESVQIEVPTAVNNSNFVSLDMSQAYPWAVELKNGEKCEAIISHEIIDGMRVRYRCNNKTVLFGHLQRCKPAWSLLQNTQEGDIKIVSIYRAWF